MSLNKSTYLDKNISLFILLMLFFFISVSAAMAETSIKKSKNEFCSEINDKFSHFGWNRIRCKPDRWKVYDYSSKGNPLLYQEFGFENNNSNIPVNLVFCGVHGDETSAIYQCFELVRDMIYDNPQSAEKFKVVIAPIINPDGFFANTRQNAKGIDPNRNFPTKDWNSKAHKLWARKKDPRRYPGEVAGSEAESKLQAYLIDKYRPDKILAFHAPLGFIDFDGPGDRKYYNLLHIEDRAKQVGLRIQKNTNRFLKFIDFRFYPGSLGNYAGNDRKIPTYTVELPSINASKAYSYWGIMRFALLKALTYEIYNSGEGNPLLALQDLHSSTPADNENEHNNVRIHQMN